MAMSQESRLVIVVDARNAERTAKALNDELKKLQTGGNQASTAVKTLGDNANNQTGKLKNLSSSMKNLAAESAKYLAGIAGAAVGSLGALAALAVQYANTAAEIERFSYLSGTTTTQFQEWAVGAKAMGIEMEKLSDIFKDTRDRIGEFTQEGSGELTKFFKEIATKTEGGAEGALKLANAMRELSGPDALLLYVEKLEEAGVSQNEFVMYMESVADEATSLIPLLENGGEGFRLWAEAARSAGAIMDNETLAAAQRLKVEANLLTMQMDGLKNQFMSALLPALNQIASAILDTTEEGVKFNVAGETVGNTMLWLAKVGMGVAATFDIIGTTIGGAVAAMTDKGVTHQMVLDDLSQKLENYGQKFEKLNDSTSHNKMVEALTKVNLRANDASKAMASGAANSKAMAKALEDSSSGADKLKQKAEQLQREINRIREQITYEYADREKQIEINLQKELADIRKAGMGSGYEERAKARANAEKAVYVAQLNYEMNEYRMTEQEKVKYKHEINQKALLLDQQLTAKQIEEKSKALKAEAQLELAQAELSKQQRINSAREQFLDTTYAMQERYRLERAEIQLINGELERNFRLEMSRLAESTEARKRLMDAQTAWANTQAQMNGTSEYQGTFNTQNSRMTESQELFDAQMAMANSAEERLAIWQAYQDRLTQIEQAGSQARRDLTFAYAQSMVGGYTDMFKDMMGEQSTAYKAMFAVQKAFALAQVLLNAPESYSKAYNAMVGIPYIGPVVAPAAGIAAVALQLAQAAQIKSVNLGFKTGGYTGNGGTSDVAGVVHGQEYVLNAAATKRVGVDTLNAINSGGSLDSGVNITINNNVNADVMATQNSDGSVTIDIVERKIQESWGRVRNASSNESRVIQQSFGMQPAR